MTRLPVWLQLLVYALLAVVLYGLVHAYNLRQQGIGEARVRAEWRAADTQRLKDEADERARLDAQRKESDRETQHLNELAASARAGADRASGQLRDAARARVDQALAADSAAVSECPATRATVSLLEGLLERSDGIAGELAAYADSARIAGQQCERDYDALTRERGQLPP